MKPEKIYAMFKKKDFLKLWDKLYTNKDGETETAMQYLTDGTACYPLENLPLFDPITINGLLGIDDGLNCTHDIAPKWFETVLSDYDDSDVPLTETADMFGYAVLETYHNSADDNFPELCFFVDPKYLAPIRDEKYDLISRSVKIVDDPVRVIVVKAGLILKAVIIPHVFNEFECDKHFKTAEKVYAVLRGLRDHYSKSGGENEDDIKL